MNYISFSKKWRVHISIVFCIILIILISIGCIINFKGKNNNEELLGKEIKLTSTIKKDLYNIVKEDIKKSLKTPANATFQDLKKWTIRLNRDNIIEISSYVDSQNSYGAMLRAHFMQKYIPISKDNYLCIYKEFDNNILYDITENSENKNVMNKRVFNNDIDKFIEKTGESQYNTLYNKTIDYAFNEETQKLEWNIKIVSLNNEDLKNNCYLALTSAIDECVCIPTVETNINVYADVDGQLQKLATVSEINFKFITQKWNNLCYLGINNSHITTEFEKELGEKLQQEESIKNLKVDYWNK